MDPYSQVTVECEERPVEDGDAYAVYDAQPPVSGKSPLNYVSMMAHEEMSTSDEEGQEDPLFVRPDIGRYLDHFDLTPQVKIALARTYASYLSSMLPESAARIASRKRNKTEKK